MSQGKKRFSKDLFDKWDYLAREAGKTYLKATHGIVDIEDNPERYGCDLMYKKFGEPTTYLLECEVKRNAWKDGVFRWPDINVLFRKKKYWDLGASLFLLSDDRLNYLLLTAEAILSSPVKRLWNKYMPQGEEMFVVEKNKAVFGSFSTVQNWSQKQTFLAQVEEEERDT